MRKSVILVAIVVAFCLGFYFLFIKESAPPSIQSDKKAQKKTEKTQHTPSSPAHYPTKYHPEHYSGPENPYADIYLNSEHLRDELHLDREELADDVNEYDRYNHYDYHDQYQDYYNEYGNDDYYYDDYYDYIYPQMSDWEWQRLNETYSDPDVKDYLNDELNVRKLEKDGKKTEAQAEDIPSDRLQELNKLVGNRFGDNLPPQQKKNMFDRVNQATKNTPVEKLKKINKKLSEPAVQKENNLKTQFKDAKQAQIKKVGPNKERMLDLFQAKKGEQKFYIFGTHEKESFKEALPETLHRKVLTNDLLITDDSSQEIREHFASEKKAELSYDRQTLEGEITRHKGKKSVVVVKATLLFGDEGLLKHLFTDGYTIMRYNPSSELLKFEP
jgi:hypothetical protein